MEKPRDQPIVTANSTPVGCDCIRHKGEIYGWALVARVFGALFATLFIGRDTVHGCYNSRFCFFGIRAPPSTTTPLLLVQRQSPLRSDSGLNIRICRLLRLLFCYFDATLILVNGFDSIAVLYRSISRRRFCIVFYSKVVGSSRGLRRRGLQRPWWFQFGGDECTPNIIPHVIHFWNITFVNNVVPVVQYVLQLQVLIWQVLKCLLIGRACRSEEVIRFSIPTVVIRIAIDAKTRPVAPLLESASKYPCLPILLQDAIPILTLLHSDHFSNPSVELYSNVVQRIVEKLCRSPTLASISFMASCKNSHVICESQLALPSQWKFLLLCRVRDRRGVMPEFLRLTRFGDGWRNWWVEEMWVLWTVGEEDRRGLMPEEASGRDLDALAMEKSPNLDAKWVPHGLCGEIPQQASEWVLWTNPPTWML
ncbi:hypothetical protein RHSIM_RhsimUnG0182400 [Rhododendron simsii]|uniref:Uncharacterized protein n=1 Tax=Rhododendron simsii TaxID=118357 RepID=A0A834FU08_RHOSS|nr:hypothetical protein RHSIM_RhsimUnG0182400 [Rhododendron simsii]